ncbi:MAG: hypothetical protein AAGE96_06935 [Cyanobacteria bacterium P01_G01_bin.19]
MTELLQDLSLAQARSLIDSYSFDLGGDDAEHLLAGWLDRHHASWIRLATIEALYLGRYKAVSVGHILNVWSRIGTPNPHFTYEFERLICRKLPKHLSDLSDLTATASKTPSAEKKDDVEDQVKSEAKATTRQIKPESKTVAKNEAFSSGKVLSAPEQGDRHIPLVSALRFPYQTDWSEFAEENKIIHQFIPLPDVSSFFNKLKTFGEEKLEG